jgi:hypothetical protein
MGIVSEEAMEVSKKFATATGASCSVARKVCAPRVVASMAAGRRARSGRTLGLSDLALD